MAGIAFGEPGNFLPVSLQTKQSLGVFIENFFFDLFGQHRVVAEMLKIPWELAIPVRDIRRK